MEQRFRYTGIREELESSQHVCRIRRKCEKCLRESESDQESTQKTFDSQKIRKKKRTKKSKDLRSESFLRDPSPSAEDELEKHLDKLRIQVRKEIHTLLYLNNAVVSFHRYLFFNN
uniref:Uncharacterized protein n=1 Tax=Onchocerca flexuosa TaxID=387005 RepID=A0A183H6P1_9BILA